MRGWTALAVLSLTPSLAVAGNKLTLQDRIELTRGLTAEYATVKQLLPRSKKALPFEASGTFDKQRWEEVARESGPAARVGDLVQVTHVDIEDDKLVLKINGGGGSGRKWYQGLEIGLGNSTTPVSRGDSNAVGGAVIEVLFHKPLEPIKAAEIKKLLAPVLDFERRSASTMYADTLPPEIQAAVKEKRAMVGMDREQVILALGRPEHKSRETDKDGLEVEDWVFGRPPGKITFVTFNGPKVIKVKESYAGLGSEVAAPPVPR